MNKKIKSVALLLLVVGAIGAGFSYKNSAVNQTSAQFITDQVKRGNVEKVVLTNGVLYPSKLVSVGAQVSGLIDKIDVQLGDEIKEGDLIAQLDNLTQQNALKEAQASLKSINAQFVAKQAQIKFAVSEFKRNQKMLVAEASSQSEYDSAESILAIYRADLEQLKAEKEKAVIAVDNALVDLGYTTITAPIDGTVVYVSVEAGQTVNNNQGTPSIIELAQLDVMTIKAQVSEADIINVNAGDEVYFTILGATQKRYRGVLRLIEPGPTLLSGDDSDLMIGDDEAIYYNALFDVANPDKLLRFGMTAQVSIVLESAQDVLLVPAQVLVEKRGANAGYQVPVKVNERIEYRPVTVGINNKIVAQILSGLNEGEEIVIGEYFEKENADSSGLMDSVMGGNNTGKGGPGGPGKR